MKPVPVELTGKLMDAAELAASGPGLNMSMDDLAKASGVPRATLYYYFAGKHDLVGFYVGVMMRRMHEAVAEGLSHPGTPTEQIEALVRAIMRTFAEYPRMCVEMAEAIGNIVDYIQVFAEMQTGVIVPAVGILAAGNASGEFDVPDPATTIVAITGGLHMVATTDIVTTGKLDADARSDVLVPMMLKAIAKT
jgi:TetR/AcrR family transcriptional regulator